MAFVLDSGPIELDEPRATVRRVLPAAPRVESARQRSERVLGELGCETSEALAAKMLAGAADLREQAATLARLKENVAALDAEREACRLERVAKREAYRTSWADEALVAWAAKLPRTRARVDGSGGGESRAKRLQMCGVAFAAKAGEEIGWERRGCNDRLCPACSAQRSRQTAAAIRELVASRAASGRVLFATFTHPKRALENPRSALDRLMTDEWRALARSPLMRKRTERGRTILPPIVGGLRSVEVTARKRGELLGPCRQRVPVPKTCQCGRCYQVEIPGIHAHIHALLELREGDSRDLVRREVIARWQALSGASSAALDIRNATAQHIYQAAKYALDFSGLADIAEAAPGYTQRVLEALSGRRLAEPFGEWRGKLTEDTEGGLYFGDRSIAALTLGGARGVVSWPDKTTTDAAQVLAAAIESKTSLRSNTSSGRIRQKPG